MPDPATPNTVFRNSNPLDFDFYNEANQQVLFIQDDDSAQRMYLEIHNTSQWEINIPTAGAAATDVTNYHFALRFRHGTLREQSEPKLASLAINSALLSAGEVTCSISKPQIQNDTVSFNIANVGKNDLKLAPGARLKLALDGLAADGRGGARNTRVELRYQKISYANDPSPISGGRMHHLSIVNHQGQKNIPLHVSVIGSNTILNDGATPNEQCLRITNVLSDGAIGLVPTGDAASRFVLSFDVFNSSEMNDWALGNPDAVDKINPQVITSKRDANGKPVSDQNWKITRQGQGESPEWIIEPVNKNSLAAGESVLLLLSNIISSMPIGAANVYLHYANIPGYWDGQFVVSLEKTALVQRDKFVGVGSTNDPAAKPDLFADVQFEVKGRANIWSGERYAVAQNYMAPGSLTIGNLKSSFGGSTNNWTTNTAGLLLETQANTEIAVHNNARRVASLLYYEGNDLNRLTIGRNMGGNWGPLSVVALYGNVGIGTNNPGPNRLAILQQLGSDNISQYQHNLQLEIRSGLGQDGTRSMGIGLLDNGKGVLQVKEANVGYNDLLLNPVAGNVGIGPLPPNCKLTIGAWEQAAYLNVKAASGGYELLMGADAGGGIVSVMTNHDLQLRAGGNSTKVTVKASGELCIGPLTPMGQLTVDTGGGGKNSIWCEHHGSNFIVRPLSPGSNVTVLENSAGGGLYLNTFITTPSRIVIGDYVIECRHEGAWGQQTSGLYFSKGGRDLLRLGDIQDMMQIHTISDQGKYFYCNDQGNTGWNR